MVPCRCGDCDICQAWLRIETEEDNFTPVMIVVMLVLSLVAWWVTR